MKISFKKFISSALATVMAMACVGVVNVSSVFAAENVYYLYYDGGNLVNTNDYFGGTTSSTLNSSYILSTPFTFDGESESHTCSYAMKLNSSGQVTFNVTGTATVEFFWSNRTNKTGTSTLKVDGTNTNETATETTMGHAKVENLTAGSHTITRGESIELALYAVKVTDVVSDDAKDYTISGSSNVANTTFTLTKGNEVLEAEVGADGSWKVSKTAETSPFTVGDEYTVALSEYSAEPSSIKLAAGSNDTEFVGGDIQFTKLALANLENKTYKGDDIALGLPNFEKQSNLKTQGTGNVKFIGDFKFKLGEASKIDMNMHTGSSTSGVDADVKVSDSNGEVLYEKVIRGGIDNKQTDYFMYLPAGEYTVSISSTATGSPVIYINSFTVEADKVEESHNIVKDESKTDVAVLNNGKEKHFVVSVIKGSDVAGKTSVSQSINGVEVAKSDTIYKSITLGEKVYDATSFGGTAEDFLFASVIHNDTATTDVSSTILTNATTVLE